MSLTREQMEKMGMTEEQIQAILGDEPKVVKMPEKQNIPAKFGVDVPVNCTEAMQITTISDLQQYSRGTLVRFPDFAEGQPFVARVRRPSMLVLAKQGKIPNGLLNSANELFTKGGGGMDADDVDLLPNIYSIMEVICDAALQEPSYQQIKEAGLELSDDQMMAIFNYTQSGVKALESFR